MRQTVPHPPRRPPAIFPVHLLRADRGDTEQREQRLSRLVQPIVGVAQDGIDGFGLWFGH